MSCAIAAFVALAIGCGQSGSSAAAASSGPPTERWTEVTSEAAPLVGTLDEKESPNDILRRGELLRVGASTQITSWKGRIDDAEVTRDGMVFRVQRAKDGAIAYAFQADLGGEVTVTATSWLCGELAKQPLLSVTSCASGLRRARAADGAIVSYLPTCTGLCPVALEREKKLGSIGVEGLTSAHFLSGKKKSVLVVEARYVKEQGKVTGGSVEILTLDGAEPVRTGPFPSDEIDARDPDHVVSRIVKVAVDAHAVHLTGQLEEHGPGGKLTSSKPIDEKHPLPPLD